MTTEISRLRALAQLRPAFEPVRDAQLTFRVLLDAMARPGTVKQLPVAAGDAPVNPWLAAVLVTLLDHEVSLAVESFVGAAGVEQYARSRTAVTPAAAEQADFVVASWESLDAELPSRLRQGSLAYPNDSATLVVLVPTLDRRDALQHDRDRATRLTLDLAGPGVPAEFRVGLAGLPAALFEARDAAAEYPCGIDLILVDPDGRVAAIPRSTAVRIHDDQSDATDGR